MEGATRPTSGPEIDWVVVVDPGADYRLGWRRIDPDGFGSRLSSTRRAVAQHQDQIPGGDLPEAGRCYREAVAGKAGADIH